MKNWIYIKKTNSGYDEIKAAAVATVVNVSKECYNVVRTDIASKYLGKLENVNIGHPKEKEEDSVLVLDLPDYAPFRILCEKTANILNVQHEGIFHPYLGFVREKNEIDEQLATKEKVVLFCYYLNEREFFISSYLKQVVANLCDNGLSPVCCGTKREVLLEGAYDFRELIEIDEIIKNRSRIKAIVTSEPIVKYIGQILDIPVVYLFSYAYTVYRQDKCTTFSCPFDFVSQITRTLLDVCNGVAIETNSLTTSDARSLKIKKFEVPYNFDEEILPYYEKYSGFINFLFLPPYKDDTFNTRTYLQSKMKGRSYMPQSREEYEYHMHLIKSGNLRFVVLWQDRDSVISKELLDYYTKLGACGFIIANDKNAKIIKEYNPNLLVISSIVQRLCKDIRKMDFTYYDYIVMFYPFTRSLNILKSFTNLRDKLIIMPNSLCHTDCPGVQHWFAKDVQSFDAEKLCPAYNDESQCTFIYPEHLNLFDDYVVGYKLQGREWRTDYIVTICESFFNRITLRTLLPDGKDKTLRDLQKSISLEEYYNLKTKEIENLV
ncbi:MAG: hypothetical protein ACI31F_06860 [Muribaculaceae bacterium]